MKRQFSNTLIYFFLYLVFSINYIKTSNYMIYNTVFFFIILDTFILESLITIFKFKGNVKRSILFINYIFNLLILGYGISKML